MECCLECEQEAIMDYQLSLLVDYTHANMCYDLYSTHILEVSEYE